MGDLACGRNINLIRPGGKKRTSRYKNIGILTIYFQEIPDVVQMDSTIEFDIAISRIGNRYAKFISVADRNQALFNTEDRTQ